MISKKHIYTTFNIVKNVNIIRIYRVNNHFRNGFKRVYHHHLMKTGGTSLNKMFLNLSNSVEYQNSSLYDELMNQHDLRLVNNNWVYTSWNQLALSTGFWHYGWSHRPIYKTFLPSKTFIITSLRNPRERVYSRYKQLTKYCADGNHAHSHHNQFKWMGSNFEEYLQNIPQKEMCHQLFMFSKKLDVEEGINRLMSMNYIIDLNRFDEDIEEINGMLGLNLEPMHTRKTKSKGDLNLNKVFRPVKYKIKPEIEFHKKALQYKYLL